MIHCQECDISFLSLSKADEAGCLGQHELHVYQDASIHYYAEELDNHSDTAEHEKFIELTGSVKAVIRPEDIERREKQ